VLVCVVSGAAPGAVYAVLVGAVHFAVYRRWEPIPAFAVGSILAGALLGLVGGILWAFSGCAAGVEEHGRPPTVGGRPPEGTRGTADEGRRGRQPDRPCDHANANALPRLPGYIPSLYRRLEIWN
jgi:hypothetical protein